MPTIMPDANVARVFVVQQPRPKPGGWTPDLSSAAEFGRVEFIFGMEDRPYVAPREASMRVAGALEHFNPEVDYLLWPHFGDPAAMWIVLMHLCGVRGFTQLKFLYWTKARQANGQRDTNQGYYFALELEAVA